MTAMPDDLINDEGVVKALTFMPPGGPSHDERCSGECGPCGGIGGIEVMTCLTCGGSGKCQGCGFGAGYAAGAHAVYRAFVAALGSDASTETHDQPPTVGQPRKVRRDG